MDSAAKPLSLAGSASSPLRGAPFARLCPRESLLTQWEVTSEAKSEGFGTSRPPSLTSHRPQHQL